MLKCGSGARQSIPGSKRLPWNWIRKSKNSKKEKVKDGSDMNYVHGLPFSSAPGC